MKPDTLPQNTALTSATRHSTASALIALVFLALGQMSASAQILISNFSMSSNSVSFDISGKFPDHPFFGDPNILYFTNPDLFAEPGFTITSSFNISSTASFTGSQPLRSFDPVATGVDIYGDYFYVAFEHGFGRGEAINGTVAATWNKNPAFNSAAFNPDAVSSLNVFGGLSLSLSEPFPILPATPFSIITSPSISVGLTSVVVPEPSTYALLLMSGAGALWWSRRRR